MPEQPVEEDNRPRHETKAVCQNCRSVEPFSNINCSKCGYSLHTLTPLPPPNLVVESPTAFSISAPSNSAHTDAEQRELPLNLFWLSLLFAVSGGLYLYYWTFLTWKQLESETGERHYPVWHALSLMVPIYSSFRFHKHLSVIRDLVPFIVIVPGWGIIMLFVAQVLQGFAYQGFDPVVSLALWGTGTCLYTGLMVVYQGSLNQYWQSTYPLPSERVSVSLVEVLLVMAGFLLWLGPSLTFLLLDQ